jgi:WD40 repeat protein
VQPAPSDDLTGRRLGEFVVKDKLGEGGFGEVYRAEQPILGREAVIKVLHDRHQGSPAVTQRFLREARLGSRLDHPYAAHIYGFGAEPDGVLWIAMELVRGTPLSEILAERRRIPLDQLVPLVDRLSEVVHTAHEQGIVHRDLKPANVMVIARAGRWLPKLLDLGIAKGGAEEERTPVELVDAPVDGAVTRRGDLVGSPRYMAPEQWMQGKVDGRTDVYALAILAYECANGRTPFPGETLGALARAHAQGKVPPVERDLPAALDAVFQRALAKRPEDRHATALELARELRTAAGLAPEGEPLPRLDEELRDRWLADAPQPLAEAVAVLDGARHLHQAHDAVIELGSALLRWLGILAICAHTRVAEDQTPPRELAERLLEVLRRRHITEDDWRAILRDLLVRWQRRPDAHPIPELVRLGPRLAELFDPLIGRGAARAERELRDDLVRSLSALRQVLQALDWILEYPLVVADGATPLRWSGVRRTHRRALIWAGVPLAPGRAVIADGQARPVVALWPLVQIEPPTPGAPPEAFLLDGRGARGARLVAFPRGFERQDEAVWDWFGREILVPEEREGGEGEPYRGLAAFTAADADRFVGRERAAEAFVNRLRESSFLAVVGPSGAGKSSFVHAGVVPLLPPAWRVRSIRPTAAVPADAELVVVDQLEELFTLVHDPEARRRFLTALAACPRVVVTLRDDFLARAANQPLLGERLRQGLELLTTPSDEDLLRILTVPAQRAGYGFDDPELPARMVAEVAGRPGALALLSFTAARLWAERDRHFKQLTRRAYEALGGVAGALAQHAEAVLGRLTHEEQRLVREAFRHLVTAEGTRAVLSRTELLQALGGGEAVLDKLIDARLLVAHDEGDVEIIHETLLVAWPRLVTWQREDAEGARLRDQLRAAARQWEERGRPRGLLWRDEALAEFVRWRARFPGGLSDVEEGFGRASVEDAARAKRARRLLLGGIIVGLAIALVVTLSLARTASRSSERAELERARAERTLTDQYEEQGRQLLLAGDTPRAVPYLLEARARGNDSPGLRLLLGRADRLIRRQALLLVHGAPVRRALYTRDGARIVTAADDGVVRIWNAGTGGLERTLAAGGPAQGLALAPADDKVLVGTYSGQTRLFALDDGRLLEERPGTANGHPTLAFAPDGQRYLVAGHGVDARVFTLGQADPLVLPRIADAPLGLGVLDDGRFWLASRRVPPLVFDRAGGTSVRLGSATDAMAVAVSPKALAEGGLDGTVRLFDLGVPASERVVGRLAGVVQSLAFSPDGARLAAGGRDGSLELFSLADDKVVRLPGHTGFVLGLAFDASGQRLVSASGDTTARIWNVARGRVDGTLAGHTARVVVARFAPDGRHIMTASHDGTVRVWQARDPELLAAFTPAASMPAIMHWTTHGELLTVSQEGVPAAWRLTDDAPTRLSTASPRALVDVVPRADGLLVLSRDGSRVFTPAGEHAVAIPLDEARGADLVAVDGPLALLAPNEIRLIDLATGRVADRIATGEPDPTNIRAIPGGRVAISARGGKVAVWDLATRRLLHRIEHPPLVLHMIATSDGTLLTAGENATVRIWGRDGALVGTLEGHTDQVSSVAVSQDGAIAATAGADGTARVWDLRRRLLLASFRPSGRELLALALEARGQRLAAADQTGEVFVWDLRPYDGSAAAMATATACHSPFRFDAGRLLAAPLRTCAAAP